MPFSPQILTVKSPTRRNQLLKHFREIDRALQRGGIVYTRGIPENDIDMILPEYERLGWKCEYVTHPDGSYIAFS